MTKKGSLTPGDHECLGVVLVRMRDELVAVHAVCRRAYPKAGRVNRAALNAEAAVDRLRSELDSQISRDLPGISFDTLNNFYYGTARSRKQFAPDADAIRGWVGPTTGTKETTP